MGASDGENNGSAFVLKIVWGAMLASLVIYAVVLVVVAPEGGQDPSETQMMAGVFGMIALSEIGVIVFLRRSTFFQPLESGSYDSEQEVRDAYFTTCILTWALAESIAIYGFVLSILNGDILFYGAFGAVGAALQLYYRPTLEAILDEFKPPRDASDEQVNEW